MILNMISTTSMIQLGKVFRGFMVDVQPTNQKLIQRAKRIICETTGCTEMEAEHIFQQANQDVKLAILMQLSQLDQIEAKNFWKTIIITFHLQFNQFWIRRIKMKNTKDVAKQVLENVGGRENILGNAVCMTRLRLQLRDDKLVHLDSLKNIEGFWELLRQIHFKLFWAWNSDKGWPSIFRTDRYIIGKC